MGSYFGRDTDLKTFQSKFIKVYKFNDLQILNKALTHCSYSATNNYDRLEWLGDAILRFMATTHLYVDMEYEYPGSDLEHVTEIRKSMENNRKLNRIARQLQIMQYLRVGSGFSYESYNSSGDVVEALIGAIYVDAKTYGKDWQKPIRTFMSLYWKDECELEMTFEDVKPLKRDRISFLWPLLAFIFSFYAYSYRREIIYFFKNYQVYLCDPCDPCNIIEEPENHSIVMKLKKLFFR